MAIKLTTGGMGAEGRRRGRPYPVEVSMGRDGSHSDLRRGGLHCVLAARHRYMELSAAVVKAL